MKVIQNLSSRATVAETCDLMVNAGTIITNSNIGDPYLDQQAHMLTSKGRQMEKSIASSRSQEKTEELFELDSKRDSQFTALKLLVRGYMSWQHENWPELAGRIYKLIQQHGISLYKENYETESALLESLLADMSQPAIQEALDGLNLTLLISDLRQTQSQFSAAYREASELEGSKEPLTAATTLKNETREALNQTIGYLNAVSQADPARYGTLTSSIADLVNGLNQKIRTRISKN